MQNWIIPLSSGLPESLVGRKAAALGRLADAGFPVPAGVCVTTEAFHAAVSLEQGGLVLPEGLLAALIRALPAQGPLAVRSSATNEDLPGTSMAGRFTTRLNVLGEAALEQAVLDCWRSLQSAPSLPGAGAMAVLIQPLLEAECAGVCFSIDPVRQRPDLLLVSAAWGLGAGVVSGSVPSDTFRLRRVDLASEEITVADKHSLVRPAPTGGTAAYPVPENLRAAACLSEDCLQRIGQFGLAVEQFFGAPQDMEWAFAGGQVWVLQSRPITALSAGVSEAVDFPVTWANEHEPRLFWWLEQVRSGTAALLPAELDFHHFRSQGGKDAVYFGGFQGTRHRKAVNGRLYMAGDASPNTPSHSRIYNAARLDLYARLEQQGITWWEYWGPEVIGATRRLAAFDPRNAAGPALADHIEDTVAAMKRHWMIHTIVPGRPIRSPAVLEGYASLTGRPPAELAGEIPAMLSGAETVQTRLVESLYDLACLALESPGAAEAFARRDSPGEPPAEPAVLAFGAAYQRLLDEYGDRLCARKRPGFPVEFPLPWREDPEYVWAMIAAYLPLAAQGGPGLRQARLDALRAADERVEAICEQALRAGKDPELIADWRKKLDYARRNAAMLDEHNHYIDQVSEGQYIQALLHAGRWLAARGMLPSAPDVFWLHADEVLTALREPLPGLADVLDGRREQHDHWQRLIPPACLGLPPHDCQNEQRLAAPPAPALPSGRILLGQTASRGTAAGRARIVLPDTLPEPFTLGDVIIAPYANEPLIPFLPAAAAVVLDAGGPGDHFAITAREFGLPAVCATLHATQRIPAGAWVTVDADVGQVTWDEGN